MIEIAIIGAGPAGLMAADHLSAAYPSDAARITVFDRMRRPGRKFLLAGRGGLNLTNAADIARFQARYPATSASPQVAAAIASFTPDDLVAWANTLGIETFEGTSGRVFPTALKASPMLRAWLSRLADRGVRLATAHQWTGWSNDGALVFETPDGETAVDADFTILALGGASWPKLGSDGDWRGSLDAIGVETNPLVASNCGALIAWTAHYRERFHGQPLKRIAASVPNHEHSVRGDLVLTRAGLEGGPIYALGPELRLALESASEATLELDLRPDLDHDTLAGRIGKAKAKDSLTNTLRKRAALQPGAINLLREVSRELPRDASALAAVIKSVRLPVVGLAGLDRAISSAGGVSGASIATDFSLKARPDVFVAGEMVDWDAPTGGYLLQACFATGVAAARGIETRINGAKP